MNAHIMKSTIPSLMKTLRAWLMFTVLATAAGAPAGAADAGAAATNAVQASATAGATNHFWPWDAAASPEKEKDPLIIKVLGLCIGLAATVLGIGIALLAIWTEYKKRQELINACHRERMAALEKGLEPSAYPVELWQSDDDPKLPPGSGLKAGLVLLGVGAGLWLFLPSGGWGPFQRSVGAIPGAIGVAYLLYYLFEGRRRAAEAERTAAGQTSAR